MPSIEKEEEFVTLAKLRSKAGLTQRQLSFEINVTENTVSAWETGKHEPRLTISQTRSLMTALNCTFEELEIAIQNQKQLITKSS